MSESSFYSFKAKNIKNEEFNLSELKGGLVLEHFSTTTNPKNIAEIIEAIL